MHEIVSNNINESQTLEAYNFNLFRVIFSKEMIEIIVLTGILINLRPREWPQFYTLDVPYNPVMA